MLHHAQRDTVARAVQLSPDWRQPQKDNLWPPLPQNDLEKEYWLFVHCSFLPHFLCCFCAWFCPLDGRPWRRDERMMKEGGEMRGWWRRQACSHHTRFRSCCRSQEVSTDEQASAGSETSISSPCRPSLLPPTTHTISTSAYLRVSHPQVGLEKRRKKIKPSLLTPTIYNLRDSLLPTRTVSLYGMGRVWCWSEEWESSWAPLRHLRKGHMEVP